VRSARFPTLGENFGHVIFEALAVGEEDAAERDLERLLPSEHCVVLERDHDRPDVRLLE
jgi:hypothetical protein